MECCESAEGGRADSKRGRFCAHLRLTFRGNALHPRDPEVKARLEQELLVITRNTTMWKTWIGFNASHSFGAILFGLVYGDLALVEPAALFGSGFLSTVGLAFLLGYAFLGWRYWFEVPFRGIALATVLYAAALLVRWS